MSPPSQLWTHLPHKIYEEMPDNFFYSLITSVGYSYTSKFLTTFNPALAAANAGLTATTILVQALALAIIRTTYQVEELGVLSAFCFKCIIPLCTTALAADKGKYLDRERSVIAIWLSACEYLIYRIFYSFMGWNSYSTKEIQSCFFDLD